MFAAPVYVSIETSTEIVISAFFEFEILTINPLLFDLIQGN